MHCIADADTALPATATSTASLDCGPVRQRNPKRQLYAADRSKAPRTVSGTASLDAAGLKKSTDGEMPGDWPQ